ncbi:hypothetical protein Ait01nite_014590 [Actinoplanes italicus]|uniref:Ricin-type beta-trefoil lectin protein n=1 Tax=Actinoplanes italicus TaxID=113567 RepID=A0A2T0KHH6_9ACTN|nr:hypothetical protein CLV67_104420 [Actinoplanes italicus]GIE28414.1 hypothetical protein Ait01nite_014590 [Actinoplanes italicus]
MRDTLEFLAALKRLKDQSGHTFRQLETIAARNQDLLPRSTVADVLRRQTLPRADLVAAFVRACAGQEHVEAWVQARNRLAEAGPPITETSHSSRTPARVPLRAGASWRKLRGIVVLSAAVLVAGASVAVLAADREVDAEGMRPSIETSSPAAGTSRTLPVDGWYHIVPAHIGDQSLCLGEGRERNKRTDRPLAVQRPCSDVAPDTFLAATGIAGAYEIRWHNPVEGVGCLSVDDALIKAGALLQPADCAGAPHQRFFLEPSDHPRRGGFRIRPLHSGLCIGALGGPADVDSGAEAKQSECTGEADQQFSLRPVARASRTSVQQPGGG